MNIYDIKVHTDHITIHVDLSTINDVCKHLILSSYYGCDISLFDLRLTDMINITNHKYCGPYYAEIMWLVLLIQHGFYCCINLSHVDWHLFTQPLT